MSDRKKIIGIAILVMTLVAFAIGLTTIHRLYQQALYEKQSSLRTLVTSWAVLIKAIGRHEMNEEAGETRETVIGDTLHQITDATRNFDGVGKTGEFSLAEHWEGKIVFLLNHRSGTYHKRASIPFDGDLAEPMRLALSGQSGLIIGLDYRGERVLAAYEPLGDLGWGLVAKVDLAEVRQPYIRSALIATGTALGMVLVGAILILLTVNPIITRLEVAGMSRASLTALGPRTRDRRRSWAVSSVLLGGVVISFIGYYAARQGTEDRVERDFQQLAKVNSALVERDVKHNLSVVQSLEKFFNNRGRIALTDFRAFLAPLTVQHPAIQAVEWIPRVTHAERQAHEQGIRAEGFANYEIREVSMLGELSRAGARQEYFPIYYIEPFAGNERAFGFDLASDPDLRLPLDKARDSGMLIATGRVYLLQETKNQFGFLVFKAVYESGQLPQTVEERRANLRGFIVGVFRVGVLIDSSMKALPDIGLTMRIHDRSNARDKQFLYLWESPEIISALGQSEQRNSTMRYESIITVASRQWALTWEATPQFVVDHLEIMPKVVVGGGMVITVLLACALHMLLYRSSHVQALVEERTVQLARSEREYRDLVETTENLIWRCDVQGRFTYLNAAWERTHGYRVGEMLHRPFTTFQTPEAAARDQQEFQRHLAGGKVSGYETTHVSKSGDLIHLVFNAMPIRDLAGHIVGAQGTAYDITARVKTEERLRETLREQAVIFDNASEGICFIKEGIFIRTNRKCCELYGYAEGELDGKSSRSVHIDDEDYERTWKESQHTLRRGKAHIEECRRRRKDGSTFWAHVSGMAIDPLDLSKGSIWVVADITERKRSEHALREYAETKEVLLREVNHRVKNNLAAIISMLHKEEDRAESKGDTLHLPMLRDLVGRIKGLATVHSLLSASGWRPLLVTQLCEQVIGATLQGRLISRMVEVHVAPAALKVDSNTAHHLTMVINELVTNSLKHAVDRYGKVRIDVAVYAGDGMARLHFRDNGRGYPRKMLAGDFSDSHIGFDLIRGIVRKSLKGQVELRNDNGAVTMITFECETDPNGQEV